MPQLKFMTSHRTSSVNIEYRINGFNVNKFYEMKLIWDADTNELAGLQRTGVYISHIKVTDITYWKQNYRFIITRTKMSCKFTINGLLINVP